MLYIVRSHSCVSGLLLTFSGRFSFVGTSLGRRDREREREREMSAFHFVTSATYKLKFFTFIMNTLYFVSFIFYVDNIRPDIKCKSSLTRPIGIEFMVS